MRYDTEITFVNKTKEKYDPVLGDWVMIEVTKTSTSANVTDLGTNRSVTLFGRIEQGAKVVRTQPLFAVPVFDQIKISGKTYEPLTTREPLNRHTLIVQEVHDGEEPENNGA